MTDFVRIRGAASHSPLDQAHVDRAVDVLSTEFGDSYAPAARVRECLTDPDSTLIISNTAMAIVCGTSSTTPQLWLMWVEPAFRGRGTGTALLQYVVDTFASGRHLRLQCPAEREAFYRRCGFHTLYTAENGRFHHMAGPASERADVVYLLPPALR